MTNDKMDELQSIAATAKIRIPVMYINADGGLVTIDPDASITEIGPREILSLIECSRRDFEQIHSELASYPRRRMGGKNDE